MTTKKCSTKRPAKGKAHEHADEIQRQMRESEIKDLAELIEAVLHHPHTPRSLFNAVTRTAATIGEPEPTELDALAYHLAEALRIMGASEFIPSCIYNYFADALNELENLAFTDNFCQSEEYLRLNLAALALKGGAK
jgi:hypothetical protein